MAMRETEHTKKKSWLNENQKTEKDGPEEENLLNGEMKMKNVWKVFVVVGGWMNIQKLC